MYDFTTMTYPTPPDTEQVNKLLNRYRGRVRRVVPFILHLVTPVTTVVGSDIAPTEHGWLLGDDEFLNAEDEHIVIHRAIAASHSAPGSEHCDYLNLAAKRPLLAKVVPSGATQVAHGLTLFDGLPPLSASPYIPREVVALISQMYIDDTVARTDFTSVFSLEESMIAGLEGVDPLGYIADVASNSMLRLEGMYSWSLGNAHGAVGQDGGAARQDGG